MAKRAIRKTNGGFASRLSRIKGVVVDMDGTLVLGDGRNQGIRPLPGAPEFVAHLTARGIPFVAFTNGTVRPARDYVPKLRAVGIALDEHQVMTPSTVAADYLKKRGFRRVLILGGDGVGQAISETGIEIVRPPECRDVDAIFVGWHREFGVADLEAGCEAVWGGAKLFTASLAPFFATNQGRALGTSRAIVAMITSIAGGRATLLGKPSLAALKAASDRLGVATKDLAVIGDDPELEVPMAHRGQALAIGVTTGVADRATFAAQSKDRRAHFVASGIAELFDIFKAAQPVA